MEMRPIRESIGTDDCRSHRYRSADSFRDTLAILEPRLANRRYLFGNRPAFADFAMWGQLYKPFLDPVKQMPDFLCRKS